MNRHDTLYNRGREVVNCRVQRTWFKLNPYLERSYRIQEDSTNDVDTSKFVQPLQSVVLCEDYYQEKPDSWKAVSLDNFWEFLYSDKWKKSYSVRVLEGALLDALTFTLHTWEESGDIVSKETFAFARNKREIRSCYKNMKTEKNDQVYGHFEEILQIEFKYYAKFVGETTIKHKGNRRVNRYSELAKLSRAAGTGEMVENPEIENEAGKLETESAIEKSQRGTTSKEEEIDIFALMNASDSDSELSSDPDDSFASLVVNPTPTESPMPLESKVGTSRASSKRTAGSRITNRSGLSGVSAMRSIDPSSLDYSQHMYIEGLDLFDEGPVIDGYVPRGEEFYLTERFDDSPNLPTDCKTYFKRKKSALKRRRREAAKENDLAITNFFERRENIFGPKKGEVVVSPSQTTSGSVWLNRVLDKVPTFEQFLKMLEEDNKFDPRYAKLKQKQRKVKMKYKLDTSMLAAKPSTMPSRMVLPKGSKIDQGQASRISVVSRSSKSSSLDVNRKLARSVSTISEDTDRQLSPIRESLPQEHTRTRRESAPPSNIWETVRQKFFVEQVLGITMTQDFGRSMPLPPIRPHVTTHSDNSRRPVSSGGSDLTSPRSGLGAISENPFDNSKSPTQTSSQQLPYQLNDRDSKRKRYERMVVDPKPPDFFFHCKKTLRLSEKDPSDLQSQGSDFSFANTKDNMSVSDTQGPGGRRKFNARDRMGPMDPESPDVYSDDEEEVPLHGISPYFNTRKLNTWYNVEKLRKREIEQEKKGNVSEILDKYRHLQRAIQAFKKPTDKRRRKSGVTAMRGFASVFNKPKQMAAKTAKKRNTGNVVIGKLRKDFKFLKTNKQSKNRPVDLSFNTISITEFKERLFKALDDFVVREEHIVSSQGFQQVTTLTFTRNEIFQNSKGAFL